MAADTPHNAVTPAPSSVAPQTPPPAEAAEQEMRDAEELALAASGLGSGLLARQPAPESAETLAVLKVCPQCGMEYETAARFCPSDGTALRPKGTDSLIGRVLAERYHILKRIGEGGMGRVYLGEHVKMNRQCAIKVMSPALVNDHESAARFAREASSAARIIHPNVAAVFDYGESEGLVYLVMEFVEGEPLARILAREAPLSVDRALDLGRQIADGLGAAHELGIVHRDLKPDNILVSRSRAGKVVAKVVDFGIAKAIKEGGGESLTRTGLVVGTPEFMSPEQLLGDPIDARSDLYALGCILHLMLTASPPFAAPTREQMIKRRLTEDAPHVQKMDPGLPDSLDRIVARLLARNPNDRYGSAAEVRDALTGTHARRHDAVATAQTLRPTPRSAPTLAFETAALAPTELTELTARPRRRAAMMALGGVVVIAAAFAVRNGTGASVSPPPAVAQRDTAAAAKPVEAAPPVVVPAPVPVKKVVDSVALRARRARRDSIKLDSIKLAKAAAAAAVAATTPGSVQAAVYGYARAIESGREDRLVEAYPNVAPEQRDAWVKKVFARATRIRASVRMGAVAERDTTAEADFTLHLAYDLGSGETSSSLKYHATLARKPTGWKIIDLKQL